MPNTCKSIKPRLIKKNPIFDVHCVTDNDMFLEPEMQRLLTVLLRSYLTPPGGVHRIDFSQTVPGLHSFSDLYSAFLDQFEAASFGNDVFSQYLLLPMLQRQPLTYRRNVWSEHPLTLRSVQLKPQQVSSSGYNKS